MAANVLETLLRALEKVEADPYEAMEAMCIIQGRLAVDHGMEVALFGMLSDAIETTIEMDEKDEAIKQGARLQ